MNCVLTNKSLDLDILVNNASQQIDCKDLAEINMDDVEDTFRTNIIQMIGICKVALPHLQRGSNIINTSSVTAYQGSASKVDYSATKGAIVAFTRALANQIMEKGIRVNSVAPGPVYTPLQPASSTPDRMEVSFYLSLRMIHSSRIWHFFSFADEYLSLFYTTSRIGD